MHGMMATIQRFSIPAPSDALDLQVVAVVPEQPRAVLRMVHGMAEHKERYLPLMEYLAGRGYACVMHDNRGHGGSVRAPEDLGYMYKGGGRAFVEDAYAVTERIRADWPGLPVFLFGHSMGSLIVRTYLQRHDDAIDGLIVCGSPSAEPMAGLGRFLCRTIGFFRGGRHVSKLMTRMTTGPFSKGLGPEESPNAWICSDPAVVAAYDEDPLCGFPFTCDGYGALIDVILSTYRRKGWQVKRPDLPVHFISGEGDPCRKDDKAFAAAVDGMRAVGYRRVTSRLYPGMRHEIHNETGKETVWADLADTLDGWMG